MENIYINLKEQEDLFIWKWLREKHKKDLLNIDNLIGYVEDLISDVERLEERVEELERQEENDYDPNDLYMDTKLVNE